MTKAIHKNTKLYNQCYYIVLTQLRTSRTKSGHLHNIKDKGKRKREYNQVLIDAVSRNITWVSVAQCFLSTNDIEKNTQKCIITPSWIRRSSCVHAIPCIHTKCSYKRHPKKYIYLHKRTTYTSIYLTSKLKQVGINLRP